MTSNDANIREYFEEVKDQYDIDYTEFKKICLTPFKFIKERIASGELKNIRIQYLGNFEVSESRVKYTKKKLTEKFENQEISQEKYLDRMEILNSYNQCVY